MTVPETHVTADLVRDLLREQHPDLAELPIREVAGGWGNQMWRLGDELAVRMQRMDPTPELQLKERRWLPVLAPRLPLPVPTPVRFGEPSGRSTWRRPPRRRSARTSALTPRSARTASTTSLKLLSPAALPTRSGPSG